MFAPRSQFSAPPSTRLTVQDLTEIVYLLAETDGWRAELDGTGTYYVFRLEASGPALVRATRSEALFLSIWNNKLSIAREAAEV